MLCYCLSKSTGWRFCDATVEMTRSGTSVGTVWSSAARLQAFSEFVLPTPGLLTRITLSEFRSRDCMMNGDGEHELGKDG
jgi:hypothetical protein